MVIHFYPWYKFHFPFILLFLEYIVTYTKTKENKLQPQNNETEPQLKKVLYFALESNRTSMKISVMNSKNELNWINSLSDNYF